MMPKILTNDFFARDALQVACDLVGKVLRHYYQGVRLSAQIIEVEAYYVHEKGSHSSLGYTQKRRALYMPPGTIYMYYAHGGDSLNISCLGDGNAVLIKSGYPYLPDADPSMITIMQSLNPSKSGQLRAINKLCNGQTLLCRSLGLKVPEWNQQAFHSEGVFIEDVNYHPVKLIQTTRLGIPSGRDEHLPLRLVDYDYARFATSNPLTKRGWREGLQYTVIER